MGGRPAEEIHGGLVGGDERHQEAKCWCIIPGIGVMKLCVLFLGIEALENVEYGEPRRSIDS